MNLQISIFGLLVAAALYGVFGSALWAIWRKARGQTWAKIALPVLAIAVLVAPWADEVWIAWRFNELCKDAGVRVVRKVEAAGFYDDTMRSGYELVDQYGFTFMEHRSGSAGKVEHVQKVDGKWIVSNHDRPTARYHYKRMIEFRDASGIHHEIEVALKIMKMGEEVVDSQTGQVIGRNIAYRRSPGWIEGLWIQFLGTGATICSGSAPQPPSLRYPLFYYVFLPVKHE